MNYFRKLKYKIKNRYFPNTICSNEMCEFLKEEGVILGENIMIFDSANTFIDTQRAWMLEIGNYVKITRGVVILTHDYSRSVLRKNTQKLLGRQE